MTNRRRPNTFHRRGGFRSPRRVGAWFTLWALADGTAAGAWPVAALGSLAAMAGCSLTANLDSLTAKRHQADASSTAAPPDALSAVDTPAPVNDSGSAHRQDAQVDLDTNGVAPDANSYDRSVPEDGMVGTGADRAYDSPSPPDTTEVPDSRPDDDAGDSGAPLAGDDAAVTGDGGAGVDATSDARPMCVALPSQYATLHLINTGSPTTSCGYASASLSGSVAAVDPSTFAGSASCGACVRVETAAGSVVAEVVELGPKPSGANPSAVAVNRSALNVLVPDGSTFVEQGVSWRFVPCPLRSGTGMTFQFQEGSNANYAALLIQKHRFRLASVEYRSNGRFRTLARASYNYWVAAEGMGAGPFTLRITDIHGHTVEQTGVPLRPGTVFQGQAQFPECSSN